MIVSPVNADNAILQNIKNTLAQLKIAGENENILVDDAYVGCTGLEFTDLDPDEFEVLTLEQFRTMNPDCELIDVTVSFYLDKERTNLVFSENTNDNPSSFTVRQAKKLFYTPPDSLINDTGNEISETLAQRIYYVRVEPSGKLLTYRNADNLLFQSVIISTKKDPEFSANDNNCIIVPGEQTLKNVKQSDGSRGYLTLPYDIYFEMELIERQKLSEEAYLYQINELGNAVRLALYKDRYRDGNCVLLNEDIDGTYVGAVKPLPSSTYVRAMVKVQCARMVGNSTY